MQVKWKGASVKLLRGRIDGHWCDGDDTVIAIILSPQHRLDVRMGDAAAPRRLRMVAGDVNVFPAGVPRFVACEDSVALRIAIGGGAPLPVDLVEGSDGGEPVLRPALKLRDPVIEEIARALAHEVGDTGQQRQAHMDAMTQLIVTRILRQQQGAPQGGLDTYRGGLAPAALQSVQAYIEDQLAEKISVAQLAQLVNLSPYHFSRAFRQSTGCSPYQYLFQRRIERAKVLLKGTTLPVGDIGFQCGFPGHAHFSTSFRKATGVSPYAYRSG